MSERFVVGRDRELAQLDIAIGNGTDGLRLAMLSGPSGLGKTTLAESSIERAAMRGFDTVAIRGRAGSLSTPFAPIIEALPALESLLMLTSSSEADVDQCGMALVQLVTELAADRPQLIVIDDAQALDESTIAVLPYLSGVAEATNLTLLFVEQTDAIGIPDTYRSYVEGLLSRRVVSHLQLGPMGEDGIRQIVAQVLELETVEEAPAEIVERAQGNPWFAGELAAGWRTGSRDVPTTIAAAATSRLHSLDQTGQAIVEAIAICPEGAHVAWLEELADQRPREFVASIDTVLASGLVREDGEVLTISHPLMQQAVVDELSAAMKRAVHLELVASIQNTQLDPVVIARASAFHLAQSGRRGEAVTMYLEAATATERGGKLHEARTDLLSALELETRPDERVAVLRRAASIATQIASSDAPELWQELGQLAASGNDDDLYAFALFQSYTTSGRQLKESLRRAQTLNVETTGWAALSAGSAAWDIERNFEGAKNHFSRAIDLAGTTQDRLLLGVGSRALADVLADAGEPERAIDHYREALDVFISLRAHDRVVITWVWLVLTLMETNDFQDALAEIESADQYVLDLGLDAFRPQTLAYRAHALSDIGELDKALALINEAMELDSSYRNNPSYSIWYSALVVRNRAKLANDIGEPNAQEIAETCAQIASATGLENWVTEAAFETYRADARRNGVESALPQIAQLEANDEPIYVASAVAWTLRQSVLTDSAAGIARVRELRANYDKWDMGKRVQLFRDEIDAVLKVVDGGDPIALNEIANRWSEVGCALDALKVNAMSGAFLVRRGDKEAAKTFLQTAKNGLQTCGASGDADLVAALLRQTGARSRAKSRTTSVGPLTKRELEIARLVANGLKNSEVAGTLFLAEKTVAAHLSNIYGKVEVRSRVQLGQWIRENDTEFDAALVG